MLAVDADVENVVENVEIDWNIEPVDGTDGWYIPEYVVALFLSIQSMKALTLV